MNEVDRLVADLNNFKTRSAARKRLSSLGSEKIGNYLIERIGDPGLVDNAAWAIMGILTEWRLKESTGALVQLLTARPSLQSEVVRALKMMTGMDFGADGEAWQA